MAADAAHFGPTLDGRRHSGLGDAPCNWLRSHLLGLVSDRLRHPRDRSCRRNGTMVVVVLLLARNADDVGPWRHSAESDMAEGPVCLPHFAGLFTRHGEHHMDRVGLPCPATDADIG